MLSSGLLFIEFESNTIHFTLDVNELDVCYFLNLKLITHAQHI